MTQDYLFELGLALLLIVGAGLSVAILYGGSSFRALQGQLAEVSAARSRANTRVDHFAKHDCSTTPPAESGRRQAHGSKSNHLVIDLGARVTEGWSELKGAAVNDDEPRREFVVPSEEQ